MRLLSARFAETLRGLGEVSSGDSEPPARRSRRLPRERRPGGADEPTCTPGSVPAPVTRWRVATIHLGRTLPHASSGLPGSSGGQPSDASCLTLLRVGFTEPPPSPEVLVVSYTTVSPLPRRRRLSTAPPWRSVLCGTVPRVTPGGCYPPPCPAEPGRSSASPCLQDLDAAARLARPRAQRTPDPARQPTTVKRTRRLATSASSRRTRTCAPRRRSPEHGAVTAGSCSCTSPPPFPFGPSP